MKSFIYINLGWSCLIYENYVCINNVFVQNERCLKLNLLNTLNLTSFYHMKDLEFNNKNN